MNNRQRLILELLDRHGPCYGLDLVERSDGKLARGTVYVWASRLEHAGLVERWKSFAPKPHLGQVGFTITDAGRAALNSNPSEPK